jgi:hypothetical protein
MSKATKTAQDFEPGRVVAEVERWATPFVETLGDGFVALYLYGSAADASWDPTASDANLLLVAKSLPSSTLRALTAAWPRTGPLGAPANVVALPQDQLARATDTFALELAEVKYHGQLASGRDVLAELEIPDDAIRRHLERELRLIVVRLRRIYLNQSDEPRLLVAAMAQAAGGLAACARGLHFLVGSRSPLPTESAFATAADWAGVEPRAWLEAWRLRHEKEPPLAAADFYLDLLDATTRFLQRVDTFERR